MIASARRETVARDRLRFGLLSAVAEVGTGTQTLEATAARVTELIVPAAADLCTIDVVIGGTLRRLAVRARAGGSRADVEAALAAAPPAVSEPLPSGPVTSTAAQLTSDAAGRRRRGGRGRAGDATLAHAFRVRSTMVVPLVARGRTLGALTMSTTADSGRAYQAGDAELRAGPRESGRPGARQRGAVRGARHDRGAALGSAVWTARGRDDPERPRRLGVRQRCGGAPDGLRLSARARGRAGRGDHRALRAGPGGRQGDRA